MIIASKAINVLSKKSFAGNVVLKVDIKKSILHACLERFIIGPQVVRFQRDFLFVD
jgi:hypothetical protein